MTGWLDRRVGGGGGGCAVGVWVRCLLPRRGGGLSSIHSRGRLGCRSRARGASRGKAAYVFIRKSWFQRVLNLSRRQASLRRLLSESEAIYIKGFAATANASAKAVAAAATTAAITAAAVSGGVSLADGSAPGMGGDAAASAAGLKVCLLPHR